jgi:hypothetical protein
MASIIQTIFGACGGGGGEEKHELAPKAPGGTGADAPTPKGMFSALSDRVLTLAGREAPDPELDAARALLAEGALLKLVGERGVAEMARFATSPDGTMLTWQSIELQNNMPKFSGAIALAAVSRVERPPVSAIGSWLSREPGFLVTIHHSTPSEQVRIEASSEQLRNEWAVALDLVSTKTRAKVEGQKSERKIARHAQKEIELMGKRNAAEKRKAEILGSMKAGGMRHTAVAMAQRS